MNLYLERKRIEYPGDGETEDHEICKYLRAITNLLAWCVVLGGKCCEDSGYQQTVEKQCEEMSHDFLPIAMS